MDTYTILKANMKRHKSSTVGIFILMLMVSLSLNTVLSVWTNSNRYVNDEMDRLGFGEMTAWISTEQNQEALIHEIDALDDVAAVKSQPIIYSDYRIGGQNSDSEGQLISYDPARYPYKIFTDELSGYHRGDVDILPGEIYISPSLCSMFGIQIGDEIHFSISRQNDEKTFVVKGFFEDPFMGSSMIGMKSFLIAEQDAMLIRNTIVESTFDALARNGSMLHIFKENGITSGAAEFNRGINEGTSLSTYSEFVHSRTSISGFMLTLQNAFTGLLLAFVLILTAAFLVVLNHSMATAMDQDTTNIGILKAMGFTDGKLRSVFMLQYFTVILSAMMLGILGAHITAALICRMTITSTGLLIPTDLPMGLCISFSAVILLLSTVFISVKTAQICRITTMRAIHGDVGNTALRFSSIPTICQNFLGLRLAVRQLAAGSGRYISVCLIAVLLVFFASLVGRMNAWLGPDGKGMMDAFNPADLHIAVQPIGDIDAKQAEELIASYANITDEYLLAMPGISVDGTDYTANVISEPTRFHMLEGQTCTRPNEVVITEYVAADLNVHMGDTVTLNAGTDSREYTVSGIYQCANEMGGSIGISRDGYRQIAKELPSMWCTHYFLDDPSRAPAIKEALERAYGGEISIHENSWPGLDGILSAMQALMILMYLIAAIFILIVTILSGSKLFAMEQKDMSLFKSMGFLSCSLQRSYALRFGIVSLFGSTMGILLSICFTDSIVGALLRIFGISNFESHPDVATILFPAAAVVGLFAGFAYLTAGKIKKLDLMLLLG